MFFLLFLPPPSPFPTACATNFELMMGFSRCELRWWIYGSPFFFFFSPSCRGKTAQALRDVDATLVSGHNVDHPADPAVPVFLGIFSFPFSLFPIYLGQLVLLFLFFSHPKVVEGRVRAGGVFFFPLFFPF